MCMVILRTSREAARRLPSALLSRRQQPRLSASSASAWRADQPVHWRLRGTGRQRLYCTESELFYDWADPSQQPQRNAPAWRRMERVRPPAAGPHSMHCPGIGSSCSQIDRGRRMTVNAAFRSCAR